MSNANAEARAALLKEYCGSHIMRFAGYNAGRGRVNEWMAQHGDPRDPKIDAVANIDASQQAGE